MATLKLTNADLDGTNGHWSVIDGRAAVAQSIGIALRFQKGEWFADKRVGTPLLERVLGPRVDAGVIRSTFIQAIESRDGVVACTKCDLTFQSTRVLLVDWAAQTLDGEIVEGQERLIFGDPTSGVT